MTIHVYGMLQLTTDWYQKDNNDKCNSIFYYDYTCIWYVTTYYRLVSKK